MTVSLLFTGIISIMQKPLALILYEELMQGAYPTV